MTTLPKAVLYYAPDSAWSATARLALEEKGYGPDEIDLKVVNINKGENYEPTFLRLNPKATVPTLLVPYEDSLTTDVESRYKSLNETKVIVEFLDKSRSARSRTHTTSNLPAPALTPATVAGVNICKTIIDDILHSEVANPNTLRYVNARDSQSLSKLAQDVVPILKPKKERLEELLAASDSGSLKASAKVQDLWKQKLESITLILGVLDKADKGDNELDEPDRVKREAFFKTARQAWEVNLEGVLQELSKEVLGPFTLGDQISLADVHLAAWLARIVKLCGGTATDDGKTIVKKIEEHIGGGFVMPQGTLGVFWDAVRQRESWIKVYGAGLF